MFTHGKTQRTLILTLTTIGVALMTPSCATGNGSEQTDQPAATAPSLPTCAQISAVLKDFIEADSLEPVNLVLTEEDIENKTWCSWKDIPTGKSILITVSYGSWLIEDIRNRPEPQPVTEPETFLMEPDESEVRDSIFVVGDGSAPTYEQGCEVDLTYFTPTYSVAFLGDEYAIDQAKEATLRVAGLMQ